MNITSDIDDVALQIEKDLKVLGKDFVPRSRIVAMSRATKSAVSKWASAAAKTAKVPVKLVRRRAKAIEKPNGGYILRIGTLNVRGTGLQPKASKTGVRFSGGRHVKDAFLHPGRPPFRRKGKPRLPVQVPVFEVESQIQTSASVGIARLNEQFPKEFWRKLELELRKLEARRRR